MRAPYVACQERKRLQLDFCIGALRSVCLLFKAFPLGVGEADTYRSPHRCRVSCNSDTALLDSKSAYILRILVAFKAKPHVEHRTLQQTPSIYSDRPLSFPCGLAILCDNEDGQRHRMTGSAGRRGSGSDAMVSNVSSDILLSEVSVYNRG